MNQPWKLPIQVDTALAKPRYQYQSILKLATEALVHTKIMSQKRIFLKNLLKLLKKTYDRIYFQKQMADANMCSTNSCSERSTCVFLGNWYFFWLLFSRTLRGNCLCILPYGPKHVQRWHKNNPKPCPETFFHSLSSDIFVSTLDRYL